MPISFLTESDTIPDQDYDVIPELFVQMDGVNLSLQTNLGEEGEDLIDVQYCDIDEVYATYNHPDPPHTHFDPIVIDEILVTQLTDTFCS